MKAIRSCLGHIGVTNPRLFDDHVQIATLELAVELQLLLLLFVLLQLRIHPYEIPYRFLSLKKLMADWEFKGVRLCRQLVVPRASFFLLFFRWLRYFDWAVCVLSLVCEGTVHFKRVARPGSKVFRDQFLSGLRVTRYLDRFVVVEQWDRRSTDNYVFRSPPENHISLHAVTRSNQRQRFWNVMHFFR